MSVPAGGTESRSLRFDDTTEVAAEPTDRNPTVSSAVIEVCGVTKVYRSGSLAVEALREVSFEIQAGEFVASWARRARGSRR